MRETAAIIERVRKMNDTHQHLTLSVDAALTRLLPGQRLLVSTGAPDQFDPYLRAQWFPVGIGNNQLTIERPITEPYTPGQVVSLLGPVGQPLRFKPKLRHLLLLAYDTPPTPLLMPVRSLLARQTSVTLVLLGTARQYGAAFLPPEVEVLLGDDDLNWANQVTTVGWADQVLVAVSNRNELENFRTIWNEFQRLRADVPANYLFGVFTGLLPCGVGACGACGVTLKGGDALICTDGPAIDLAEVTLP